jgi:hypothetical protein
MITSKNTYVHTIFIKKVTLETQKNTIGKKKFKGKEKKARNKRITKIFKKLKNP